jgi:hypothetical protein
VRGATTFAIEPQYQATARGAGTAGAWRRNTLLRPALIKLSGTALGERGPTVRPFGQPASNLVSWVARSLYTDHRPPGEKTSKLLIRGESDSPLCRVRLLGQSFKGRKKFWRLADKKPHRREESDDSHGNSC